MRNEGERVKMAKWERWKGWRGGVRERWKGKMGGQAPHRDVRASVLLPELRGVVFSFLYFCFSASNPSCLCQRTARMTRLGRPALRMALKCNAGWDRKPGRAKGGKRKPLP